MKYTFWKLRLLEFYCDWEQGRKLRANSEYDRKNKTLNIWFLKFHAVISLATTAAIALAIVLPEGNFSGMWTADVRDVAIEVSNGLVN